MTAAFARRIAGWTSLALGKLGTLLLLWQGMRMAEPDAVGHRETLGLFGIAPLLLLLTLGMIAVGLWLLRKHENA